MKQGVLTYVALVAAVLSSVDANVAQCLAVTAVKNFKVASYAGRWFTVERTETNLAQFAGDCAYMNVTVATNAIMLTIDANVKNQAVSQSASASFKSTGVFEMEIAVQPVKLEFDYTIIDTDYNDYAAIYICGSVPILGLVELVIVQGRTRTSSATTAAYYNKAVAALKAQKLNVANLVAVNQKNCHN